MMKFIFKENVSLSKWFHRHGGRSYRLQYALAIAFEDQQGCPDHQYREESREQEGPCRTLQWRPGSFQEIYRDVWWNPSTCWTPHSLQYNEPLLPCLKLSSTLRHLASGAKYKDIQYCMTSYWQQPLRCCLRSLPGHLMRWICCSSDDSTHRPISGVPEPSTLWKWNFPKSILPSRSLKEAEVFTTITKVSSQKENK